MPSPSRKFQGVSVDVAASALENMGPRLRKISVANGCLHVEYGLKNGDCRFVLAVAPAKLGAVEQALKKLGGVAIAKASTKDIQVFRQYQAGKAETEIDF